MTDFSPSGGNGLRLDPSKRVNYSLGLVLGEDEFRQDQVHLRERDHLATRALHGYGTVAGLTVSASGTEVTVEPGIAVDPVGRLICVPTAQCADLDAWLANNVQELEQALGSPPPALPAPVSLYVLLCYRECETDTVPIPVEPCLTGDEGMVASRLEESFELRFSFEPPADVGEVAGGALATALGEITLPAVASPPALAGEEVSPPTSPPEEVPGSLPEAAALEDIVAAIRVWAVQSRPELAAGAPCLDVPGDICVLLGRVDLEVDAADGSFVVAAGPAVDDADRPVLLSTRFLQEWLARLQASEAGEVEPVLPALDDLVDVVVTSATDGQILTKQGGEWVAADPETPALDDLSDVGVTGATDGQILTKQGDEWVAADPPEMPAPVSQHGALGGLGADDHPHYLPRSGVRPLTGPLRAGNNRLTDVADAVNPGDAVTLRQLEGVGGPSVGAFLPFVTITRLEPRGFELWFNIDAPENRFEVVDLRDEPTVFRETRNGPSFLVRIRIEEREQVDRNVFVVQLQAEPRNGLLRFQFNLEGIELSEGNALEFFRDIGTTFEGQDSEGVVTTFVRISDREAG